MAITGCRNDDLTLLLNELGYQPLAMSRTDLTAPYFFSYKDMKLEPIGPLSAFLTPGTAMPPLVEGSANEIAGKESSRKTGAAVVSILGDAFKAVGLTSAPKLAASLERGKEFVFSFNKVVSKGLPYATTSRLIRTSLDKDALVDLPPGDLQAGYIHVAYEFLYAGSLGLRETSGHAASFDAKAIEVQALVDIGAKGSVEATSESSLTFQGRDAERAAFACKIGWLQKHGSKLTFHIHEDQGEAFLADEGGSQPYLLERGVVIRTE